MIEESKRDSGLSSPASSTTSVDGSHNFENTGENVRSDKSSNAADKTTSSSSISPGSTGWFIRLDLFVLDLFEDSRATKASDYF